MMASIHFPFFMDNEQDSNLDQVESSISFRTLPAGTDFKTSKGTWTLQDDLRIELKQATTGVTAFAESHPSAMGCAATAEEAIADLIQAFVNQHDFLLTENLPQLTASERKIREDLETLFRIESAATSGDASTFPDTDVSQMI